MLNIFPCSCGCNNFRYGKCCNCGARKPHASAPTFDTNQSACYTQGQLILYNGKLYSVNVDSPTGTPDSSADYTLLSGSGTGGAGVTGPTGATGATGASVASTYNAATQGQLAEGQIIMVNGTPYIVEANSPTGTPGTSADFAQIATIAAGSTGAAGGSGATGPTGPTGATGSTGADGVQGIQGVSGAQGVQGVAGTVGTIKGSYAALAALQAAHPTGAAGDAYIVSPDLYVWNAASNAWEDVGPIQGPQGVQGIQGIQGIQGATGATGTAGSAGAKGAAGPTGATGATGSAGTSGSLANLAPKIVVATQAVDTAGFSGTTTIDATCPAGEIATGGGFRISDSNGLVPKSGQVTTGVSRPLFATEPGAGEVATGWRTGMAFPQDSGTWNVSVYVLCMMDPQTM